MKIRLSTLKRIIREATLVETPEFSAMNVKPGTVLRYTGGDMEKPNMLKVLGVSHDGNGLIITAGDKNGQTHKIGEKDLHAGEYEIAQGGMPPKKKPASWDATR